MSEELSSQIIGLLLVPVFQIVIFFTVQHLLKIRKDSLESKVVLLICVSGTVTTGVTMIGSGVMLIYTILLIIELLSNAVPIKAIIATIAGVCIGIILSIVGSALVNSIFGKYEINPDNFLESITDVITKTLKPAAVFFDIILAGTGIASEIIAINKIGANPMTEIIKFIPSWALSLMGFIISLITLFIDNIWVQFFGLILNTKL